MTRLLLILALLAAPVHAEAACADRETVTGNLETKYGETFVGGGLRNSNAIFEVYANAETGTWTIISTHPTGMSCVVAAGQHWRGASALSAGIPG